MKQELKDELYKCKHCKEMVTGADSFETNHGDICCKTCADTNYDLCECLDGYTQYEVQNGDSVCETCYEHVCEKSYDFYESKRYDD
jgi:hypothetical protein